MNGTLRRPNGTHFSSVLLLLVAAVGCSKAEPPTDGARAPATAASAPGSVSAPGAGSPVTAGSPSARPGTAERGAAERWSGSYVAKVGVVEPPPAAKEKAWLDDPGATHTGPGSVELVVGEPAGEARGRMNGALGDLVLAGTFDGRELYADVRSAEPNGDGGLTGVVRLLAEGAAMKGSARLSGRDGKTVRQADVELKRQ